MLRRLCGTLEPLNSYCHAMEGRQYLGIGPQTQGVATLPKYWPPSSLTDTLCHHKLNKPHPPTNWFDCVGSEV